MGADPRHGTASFGNGTQELDVGCRLSGDGGSWVSRRDSGRSKWQGDVVVLCHDSVSLRCDGAGCWIENSSWRPAAVGCFPHWIRSLAHDHLMVDLSLRVHHQDGRDLKDFSIVWGDCEGAT